MPVRQKGKEKKNRAIQKIAGDGDSEQVSFVL